MNDRNGWIYNEQFFADLEAGSVSSAREIVPIVRELVEIGSVVDIGCGTGGWLSVFRENGTTDILGVDGDYVDRTRLLISEECFLPRDLSQELDLGRRFDLAMSVEVAEHLPEMRSDGFVRDLTALSDFVLFSAAIPHQEGTSHINEQWIGYWVDKFADHGYAAIDCFRRQLWRNESVEWWYKQNLVLFVAEPRLADMPRLKELLDKLGPPLPLVHPDIYLHHVREKRQMQQRLIVKAAVEVDGALRSLARRLLRKR